MDVDSHICNLRQDKFNLIKLKKETLIITPFFPFLKTAFT